MALNTVTYQANGVVAFGTPDPAVTAATSLVNGAGVVNADPFSGVTSYEPNKVWSQTNNVARTTIAAAVAGDGYTAWTVSRAGGMLPKQIRVKVARGALGTSVRGFRVRWSVDNYASDLLGRDTNIVAEEARPNLFQHPDAGDPLQGDLSAAPQQSSVTFRIYNYATSANNSLEFDDLELTYDTPSTGGDTTAPTVPGGLQVTGSTATTVSLSWTASTDAVGVASYRVRQGGVDVTGHTAVTGTSTTITGLSPSTAYSFTVSAVDAAGNRSAESTAAPVTTPAAGGGGAPLYVRSNPSVSTYVTSASITSHTATYTTAPTQGNLLVLQLEVDKNVGTFTVPSGWTALHNSPQASLSQLICWKFAGASESSVVINWALVQRCAVAAIHEFTSVDPSSPIDVSAAWTYVDTDQTASLTIDPPATGAAGLMLAMLGLDSTETTDGSGFQPSASGWTSRTAFQDPSSVNSPGLALLERAVTAGENLAAQTFSWTTLDQHQGFVVNVRGAASGGPTPVRVRMTCGIPSPTELPISSRTTGATSVRAQVSTSQTFASGVVSGSAVTPNAQGDAQLTVPGLSQDTEYWYRIGMTNSAGVETFSAVSTRSIRTAPTGAKSFTFWVSSCNNEDDAAIMAAIANRNPDFGLHLGDPYYYDGSGTTATNFRVKWSTVLEAANQSRLFQAPTDFRESDHNGMADGTTWGNAATAWETYNSVVREMLPQLSRPATKGTYHTWVWGRVRFIAIDRRSFASSPSATDNSSKNSLGAVQEQWLYDTINAATEPKIIIVNESPWNTSAVAGDDGWRGFTTERDRIAANLQATGKSITVLHGDAHSLAINNGTSSPHGGVTFGASPLHQNSSIKGGPYTHGPFPSSATSDIEQYGWVTVTDTGGSTFTITYAGYNTAGAVSGLSYTETVSTVQDPNEGSTSGGHAWSGTVSGRSPEGGSTSGGHSWSASVSGSAPEGGAISGGHSWAGTVSGTTQKAGAASGGHAWSGTASGSSPEGGSATGGHAWSGTASGTTGRSGSTSGGHSWSGTASGVATPTTPSGSVSGGHAWSGTVSGTTGRSGSTSGGHSWSGTASGVAARHGSASGGHSWSGEVAGIAEDARRGSVSGGHSWSATVSGGQPLGPPEDVCITWGPLRTHTVTATLRSRDLDVQLDTRHLAATLEEC